MKRKHYCKEIGCNNEISYNTWKYGQGRCRSCSKKGKLNSMFNVHLCGKNNSMFGIRKFGKNNPNFGNKGNLNPLFKGNKAIRRKKYYCIEKGCTNEIHWQTALYGGGRCNFCARKGKRNFWFGNHRFDRDAPAYIDGRTSLHLLIRELLECKQWRTEVFKRDNYTCQECGQIGGKLEAHHKIRFSKLFNKFLKEYNQFSPVEDKKILLKLAMRYKPFWDVGNGQTLCEDCHKLFPTKIKEKL